MNTQPAWWNRKTIAKIINTSELIDTWEKQVLQSASEKTKNKSHDSALQLISDQSKNLWKSFTTERSELDKDYMSKEKFFSAYMASFFLPNVERTRQILSLKRNESFLFELSKNVEIKILDFGSGPLSSSIGLIVALEEALQLNNTSSQIKKIKITAVERSEKAVQTATQLLKQHLASSIVLEVNKTTSVPKAEFFDVILASNVINEIPKKHQYTTLKNLLLCLHDSCAERVSQLLVVEPAQETFARGLSALRDEVMQDTSMSHIQIAAPCLHRSECPLSEKLQRRDWCWFKGRFDRPPFLIEIDRRTEIDHSELAYSYLLLSNSTSAMVKNAEALCVSDDMPLTEQEGKDSRYQYFKSNQHKSSQCSDSVIAELATHCSKLKLCTKDGELLAGLQQKVQKDGAEQRGRLIDNLNEFECVVHER